MVIYIKEEEAKEKLKEIYLTELFPDAGKKEVKNAVEIMYENFEGKTITNQVFDIKVKEKVRGIFSIMRNSSSH